MIKKLSPLSTIYPARFMAGLFFVLLSNLVIAQTKENFNSLSRKGSEFKVNDPVIADRSEKSTFTRELIAVQWRDLDPINLYLIKPKGVKNPPVALFLYTFPQDAKRFLNDSYCARIVGEGCAAIGFESALTGDRYRMRPMKEWFVSELQESLASTVHDIQFILDYVDSRKDLDSSRVGMFGMGSGGSIAILAAATDPRIKAVDLVNPWADWQTWMKTTAAVSEEDRKTISKPAFFKKAGTVEPLKYLGKLKGKPVRVQIVETDPKVPPACQKKIIKATPKGSITKSYADDGAFLQATSNGALFKWLSETLKSMK